MYGAINALNLDLFNKSPKKQLRLKKHMLKCVHSGKSIINHYAGK